jgi:1-acyl-sn-glycerol-3-phosphate acyltransferase
LGIFPQGTRQDAGKITNVTKGFANLARKTKCGILPIGIIGTDKKAKFPFTGKIIVKIGKLIPYSDNVQEMVDKWGQAVQELTGYEYVPSVD